MRAHQKNPQIVARYRDLTTNGKFNDKIRLIWDDINKPAKIKKPQTWAIWNDLFHPAVPEDFIQAVFSMAIAYEYHTFLFLTKRADRMAKMHKKMIDHPFDNLWFGVTVESANETGRIDDLLKINGYRFLSIEPMLSEIDLSPWFYQPCYVAWGPEGDDWDYDVEPRADGIHWVISGPETGPKRRPTDLKWVLDLKNQCEDAEIPLFIKKLEVNGKLTSNMAEWPPPLRVRQYPKKEV
jgi:protein gp37